MHALVMEYIEGPAIDDKEKILADGYDMVEIVCIYDCVVSAD